MGGYLDLEGGELKRSIFLAAKTFETHLRTAVFNNMVQHTTHFALNAQLIYNALLAHSVYLTYFK